jgi:ribosomal protein S18 acetylase RimI-like enzyme
MQSGTPIRIEQASHVDEALVEAVPRLVAELSGSTPPPGRWELDQIITNATTDLLLARDGDRIVGMATLAVFRIPTGVRAWIEDVVVDGHARGRGVGEALTREALRIAAEKGARTVELTSRPSREAANRLYQRLGFVRRETNVYRYTVDGSEVERMP